MKLRFALIIAVLGIPACQQQVPAGAAERSGSPQKSEEALDLRAVLHCGDAAFMRLSAEQQLARLRKLSQWQCDVHEDRRSAGAELALACVPTEPQRVYGARILSWQIDRALDGAETRMRFTVRGDAGELRELASRIWKQPPDGNGALALSDDGAVLAFSQNGNHGEATIRCTLPAGSKATLSLPDGWQAIAPHDVLADADSQTFESDLDPDEGVEKLEGAALKKALPTCGADHWLAGDFDTRLAELKAIGIACRKVTRDSGREAECAMPAGTRSFGGYPVEKFVVFDEGEVHEANFTVRAPAGKLAAAMASDTMTELTEYGNSAGMYVNLIDDRFRYIVWPDADHPQRSVLNCRMTDIGAQETRVQTTESSAKRDDEPHGDVHEMPSGSISGSIQYPEENVPAMRICATDRGGMVFGCTRTRPGQKTYRIDHLAPADAYVVMASVEQSQWPIGGYAQPIRCIQAPCPDSNLIPVDVQSNQAVTGIDINEFLSNADSWPPMPVEDSR